MGQSSLGDDVFSSLHDISGSRSSPGVLLPPSALPLSLPLSPLPFHSPVALCPPRLSSACLPALLHLLLAICSLSASPSVLLSHCGLLSGVQ